jgi:hypothetical protein
MLEEEVFGVLTQKVYLEYIEIFSSLLGEPEKVKRLKISYWDHEVDKTFDPQIRITNGKAEIMIKKGEWENQDIRRLIESNCEIISTSENVLAAIGTFCSLYETQNTPYIQQFENLIWKDSNYEYKLGKQFNNENTKYLYEIEALSEISDLTGRCKNLGLDKYITHTDTKFWDEWTEDVNLMMKDLSKDELKELLLRYLD